MNNRTVDEPENLIISIDVYVDSTRRRRRKGTDDCPYSCRCVIAKSGDSR